MTEKFYGKMCNVCVIHMFLHPVLSTMKDRSNFLIQYEYDDEISKKEFIILWNVAGALHSPNGITAFSCHNRMKMPFYVGFWIDWYLPIS